MIVTVFRSRVRPEAQEEYARWAARMSELAKQMPGYVSHKGFTAPDGNVVRDSGFKRKQLFDRDREESWPIRS